MMNSRCLPILICMVVHVLAAVASSQDKPPEPPFPDRKEWMALRAEEFASYRFEIEDVSKMVGVERRLLKFEPKPILDWSNPERNTIYGASFVWTYEGRPELIGS